MPCDVVMGFANHGFGQIDPRTSYLGPDVPIRWVPDHPVNRPHPKNPNAIVTNVRGQASGHWEFANLPQNSDHRLTTDETSALRNRIADFLSDPNCMPFINELF